MAGSKRAAFEVVLDARELGPPRRVGTLYRDGARADLPGAFEYDAGWLAGGGAFMLDPRLELYRGEQRPPGRAFGIFMDSAPDRWGRLLLERREAAQAARLGRRTRALHEMDFLLGVYDLTRMGALRFRALGGGPFLDDGPDPVPPAARLRELAELSRRVEEAGADELPEYERWLSILIAPGTSLGGARPKANFTDPGGRLWIAKFPAREDRYDVGLWEFVVHGLAREAGIEVPDSRLESLTERHGTFCVARFDRRGGERRMFASAMTLLERQDGESGAGYPDLAEFIADQGAAGRVEEDLAQLFRRAAFNVLVGNRDDHLRNHGFIREAGGWRLAPAYDLNPHPLKAEHALSLDGRSNLPDLGALAATAGLYRLKDAEAYAVIDGLRGVVARWKERAAAAGLSRAEAARMEPAFLA